MAQIPSFEDGNPSDWPSNFSEFKEVETILGCGICFEYMSTAMVTKCSHNFCSLCIRRYICYKQQCPICLDAVLESDLRNNRIVDEIIQHFTKSRTKLLTLMRSNPVLDQGRSSSNLGLDQGRSSSISTDVKDPGSTSGRLNSVKSLSGPDFGNSSAEDKVSELNSEKKQKGKPDVLSSYFIAGRSKSQSETNSVASLALSALSGDSDCIAVDADCDSDVTIDGDSMSSPPAQNLYNSNCLSSAKLTYSESETYQSVHCETKSSQNDLDSGSSDHHASFSSQSSINPSGFTSPASKPVQSATGLSCTTPSGPSSTLFGSGLQSPSTAAVVCPVCNIDVPSRNINLHLDRCLATEQKKDKPMRQSLRRKPMPKLVYTLLSEKDLRKKLSEVGLPANGIRQVLIKRHHEFTLLYNAQCDSLHPKSAEEIVSEMMQADALKSRSVVQSTTTTNLKLDKTSTAEQVESAQKEYVKKFKSQFDELVKAARRNKATSECSNATTVADVASTSSDADLASEATVIERSFLNIESNSNEPLIEATSQRDPEIIDSNRERSASPMASSSADFHTSRPGRRIRRKLEQSLTGTEVKDSSSSIDELPSVAVRRSLRSQTNKKKPASPESRAPADNEDADDSENVNVAEDDDDDYEVMPSYSGRKRKAGSNKKVPRPQKTRKPENMADERSDLSPVF